MFIPAWFRLWEESRKRCWLRAIILWCMAPKNELRALKPDMRRLMKVDRFAVISYRTRPRS